MRDVLWGGLALIALPLSLACNKSEVPAGGAPSSPVTSAASAAPGASAASAPVAAGAPADCGHTVCSESFFVDAVAPDTCATGARCDVTLKLVATGAFHVNDQYPYRYKAQPAPAVEFLGTDPAGKNVFSKPAGDWAQTGAKSGVLTVHLTPTAKGASTISGVFKLSVCSEQNCLIEQPEVHVAIHAS
jgi:hypothetical protein